MSADRPAGTAPRRFSLAGLTADQVQLLCTVLKASEVPHALADGHLVTGSLHSAEVEKALLWVRVEVVDEEFDDPEYRGTKPPVVKPPRPPLADGRRLATRWRRICGGLIDHALLVAPAYLAWRHDMPGPLVVLALFMATVPATVVAGWSLGKLATGTRIVSLTTLRPPNLLGATARWVVSAAPVLVVMAADLSGDLITPLMLVIYGPVVLDLRGVHDYGAGTVVVERTADGPSRW